MSDLKLAVLFLYHPLKANVIVKRRRENFHILPVILLFLFAVITRIFQLYFTHYSVATIRPEEANLVLEVAVIILPVITWFISNYALTSIMGGSAKPTEILTGIAYAYLPYIVITLFMTGFSHLLSANETGLYAAMQTIAITWQILLLFLSMKSLNDFSMGMALFVTLISVIGIAIIWALFLLLFALSSQVFYFINEIITEVQYLK